MSDGLISHTYFIDPKIKCRLACDKCWQNVFTSESFKAAWYADDGFTFTTPPWAKIQRSIELMCEWCELLSEEIEFYHQHVSKTKTQPSPEATFSVSIQFVHRTATSPLKLKLSIENSWKLSYLVFTTSDDIASRYITERGVLDKLDTAETYSMTLECVRDCVANHAQCLQPAPATLPNRVIDCMDMDCVRLFERDEQTSPAQYAALSYVWGEDQPHKTTTINLSTYLTRINVRYIPRTIRDAITVTRKLGLQYLWVDSFCIVQDSEEDKAINIAQIRTIFRHSYITIVAASASKVSDGFLTPMKLYNTPSTVPFCCPDTNDTIGTMRLQQQQDAPPEPVNTRAWCLEERVLSSRAIWYCSHTVQFECQGGYKNVSKSQNMSDPRDGVPRLPNHIFSPELSRNTVSTYHDVTNANADHLAKKEDKEARDAWHKILGLYTRRELTKPRDRLIALSGIVDYFARTWSLRSNYLAGLWRHEFPYCLLWYNVNGQTNKPAVRPVSYRAPSWSWAAIDGEISSGRIMEQGALCIVQQCYTIPKRDSNPYGEVIKGVLVLQVALRCTTWNPIEGELFEDGHGVSEGNFDCRSDHGEIGFVSVDAAEDFSSSTVEVYAAIVAQTSTALHGIIVAPVTASEMMKDANEISATNLTFRRIGWFVAPFCNREDWLRTPQQVINLI